jgi:hypothetical protein
VITSNSIGSERGINVAIGKDFLLNDSWGDDMVNAAGEVPFGWE